MKRNDLIALVIALVLLVGVGYYYYSSTHTKSQTSSAAITQVEVAPVIPNQLDTNQTLDKMNSQYKVQDFKQPVYLNGIGNSAPFTASGQ